MNTKIIDQFNLLVKQTQAELLNAQLEDDQKEIIRHKYRLNSLKKSLAILKKIDFKIRDVKDLEGIPGIGLGTKRRVKEILETGTISDLTGKYAPQKQKKIDSIQELEKIIGIGSQTAKKLVLKHKIKNISELRKAIAQGKIKVSKQILLGLKYYGIVQGNIPRREIAQIEKYLQKIAHEIDPELTVLVCGSYRRGKPFSGDIDVLLYHPKIKNTKQIRNPSRYGHPNYLKFLLDRLTEEGFLTDHLVYKNFGTKYRGFSKYKNNPVRRIDIQFVPYNSIYTAMLYFTGPAELNEAMRLAAKKRNMVLNEYGLYKVDKEGNIISPIKITSEKDVFDILGMDYLTPKEREAFSTGKLK